MAIRAWFDWRSIPLDGRPATRGNVAVECPNGSALSLSAIARSESVDFVDLLENPTATYPTHPDLPTLLNETQRDERA